MNYRQTRPPQLPKRRLDVKEEYAAAKQVGPIHEDAAIFTRNSILKSANPDEIEQRSDKLKETFAISVSSRDCVLSRGTAACAWWRAPGKIEQLLVRILAAFHCRVLVLCGHGNKQHLISKINPGVLTAACPSRMRERSRRRQTLVDRPSGTVFGFEPVIKKTETAYGVVQYFLINHALLASNAGLNKIKHLSTGQIRGLRTGAELDAGGA